MDDVESSRWLLADGLRPAPQREELSLAARLECARSALLFAEDALANGLPRAGGGRGRLKASVRDELVLTTVRNALGLIG